MATSARCGGDRPWRPGERLVWPPPLPPRPPGRGGAIDPRNNQRYTASVVAVMATLDLEAVRPIAPSSLPPEIMWAVRAFSDAEWAAVAREAIRMQRRIIGATQGAQSQLRRDDPWLLADFLPTMR
jgi:hypothetical protein